MAWLLVGVVLVVTLLVLVARSGSADVDGLGPQKGPSWMPPGDWADRVTSYRRQGRTDEQITDVAQHLQRRGPKEPHVGLRGKAVPLAENGGVVGSGTDGTVWREDYVAKEDEGRYIEPPRRFWRVLSLEG